MNTNNAFIDNDEKALSILGADYLNGNLESDSMEKGIVTLTDKRLYFKGKSYTKGLLWYKKQESTKIVDVTDLVDMEVRDRSKKIFKYLAMLPILSVIVQFMVELALLDSYTAVDSYMIVAPVIAAITILINAVAGRRKIVDKRNWFNYLIIVGYIVLKWILVLNDCTELLENTRATTTVRLLLVEGFVYTLLYIIYAMNDRKYIEFIFVNGNLLLSKHDYSDEEIAGFRKMTMLTRDKYRNADRQFKQEQFNILQHSDSSVHSVADELVKYKELMDEGIITAEEFAALKAKVINQAK